MATLETRETSDERRATTRLWRT